jgi:hypothetical protein
VHRDDLFLASFSTWQHAYHGDNFDRLVRIKADRDPDDVFRFAQSIPTGIMAAAQQAMTRTRPAFPHRPSLVSRVTNGTFMPRAVATSMRSAGSA